MNQISYLPLPETSAGDLGPTLTQVDPVLFLPASKANTPRREEVSTFLQHLPLKALIRLLHMLIHFKTLLDSPV